MAVAVHEANIQDSKGAPQVIDKLTFKFPSLIKILADGGYRGTFSDWILYKFGWELEVHLRPDECPSKFQVLPKRWIVERSLHGLRISEGLPLTKSTMQKQLLPWCNWSFAKSCLINILIDF